MVTRTGRDNIKPIIWKIIVLPCTVLAVCFSLQQGLRGEALTHIDRVERHGRGPQEKANSFVFFSRPTPISSRTNRPLAFTIAKHSSIEMTLREK